PDIVRRRPVFEHVEQSRHILLDTGVEQLLNDVVATQFRNVGSYELPDVVSHVEDVAANRRCHLRQLATDGVYAGAHAVIVWRVSRPLLADSAADGGQAMHPTSVPVNSSGRQAGAAMRRAQPRAACQCVWPLSPRAANDALN